MKFLFSILLGVITLPAVSQVLYFSSINDSLINKCSDIFKLDLANCLESKICDNQCYYTDFAIRPPLNSWISIDGALQLGWFQMNECNVLKWGGTILQNYNLLTPSQESDKFGYIWCFGTSGLIKINPPTNFYEFKGSIDISRYQPSRSTFLNGKVYSICGEKLNQNFLYVLEYDTLDPLQYRIICSTPNNPTGFYSLFATHESCGVNQLIGVNHLGDFYSINTFSGQLKFLCRINLPSKYKQTLEGSSPWQYNPSDCDVFLDLDINNSSGDNKNGFVNSFTCSNQLPLLSDIDPDVFSDYGILDSIQISILNPLDGNQEFISYIPDYNISGLYWPNHLSLFPTFPATNDSFVLAIKSLRYVNHSCSITEADRFIQFIAFKNSLRDTAYCKIHVEGPFYNAGQDGQLSICSNNGPVSLYASLGNCYTLGGFWSPALHASGVFDPSLDLPSNYYYIIGDSICGYDSAKIQVIIQPTPFFKFQNDTSLCYGDSLVLSIIDTSASYLWNDGSTLQQKIITRPGLYWLELSNSNLCSYRDSIRVIYFPKNQVSKEVFICANQILEYKSMFFKPGDLILDTFRSSLDCDTFVQIQIIAIPVPAPNLLADTLVCQNSLTSIRPDQNYTNYTWSTQEQTESIFAKAGSYTLTVTDENGCTNSTTINIHELPEIQFQLQVNDPLCAEDKGSIILKTISGGTEPIKYFLNGKQSSNGIFDNLNPGTYFALIKDSEGCLQFDTIQIIEAPQFNISLVDKVELLVPGSILIKYIILDGTIKLISFSPSHQISLEGNDGLRIEVKSNQDYIIQFEDPNGCVITRKLQIILKKNDRVYIPNVFSPNGDNVNDKWAPTIGSEYTMKQCFIYDRWGNQVYHSKDEIQWDGRFNDLPCTPGVYIYYLELQNNINQIQKWSGDLTIIR